MSDETTPTGRRRFTLADLNQRLEFNEHEVEIPELGDGVVLLRQLSAGKQARLLNGLLGGDSEIKDLRELQARMFAASAVDPKVKVGEARALSEMWPPQAWNRVMDAINELSPNSRKVAEEVERAAADEFQDADE